MEQNDEKIAGTSLTVVPEYSQTAIGLAELSKRLKGLVFDVTTKAGMKAAKEARAEARKLRTTLEAKRKEIKAPALERCRQIDEEAKRITSEIVALEEPIALQIENEEARAEAERLAELQREQDRVDAHKARIQGYRDLPGTMIGWPSSRIERHLSQMEAPDFAAFEEFAQEASDAYAACHARIQVMYQDVKRQEADAERLKAQEAELAAARERIERMEREAEERRQADEKREREAREEADRKEGERVNAILFKTNAMKGLADGAKWQPLEAMRATLDQLRSMNPEGGAFDFAEFHDEALQVYARSVQAVEQAINARETLDREASERAEADRIERQRLAEEAAENARKAVAAEQERAQAAREAELARQDALTLRTASEALLHRVTVEGHGQWREAIDLGMVLATSEGDVKPTKRQAAKPAKVAR